MEYVYELCVNGIGGFGLKEEEGTSKEGYLGNSIDGSLVCYAENLSLMNRKYIWNMSKVLHFWSHEKIGAKYHLFRVITQRKLIDDSYYTEKRDHERVVKIGGERKLENEISLKPH